MTNFKQTFNIIKYRGSPQEAETIWGDKVERQEQLFVQDFSAGQGSYTGFVPCIPYDNHFIYEVPIRPQTAGHPSYMCTCGSFAVILTPDSYEDDMSRHGLQFGCYYRHVLFDEDTGKFWNRHADGST
jgi:hypothetical protein